MICSARSTKLPAVLPPPRLLPVLLLWLLLLPPLVVSRVGGPHLTATLSASLVTAVAAVADLCFLR